MENLEYLFAAFTIIWAVIFGYVFFLYYRQRKLGRQLDLLKNSLGEPPNRDASGESKEDVSG
jgi:CcmD family protein